MIIAVDFDGTIVEHRYPDIGEPCPGAIDCMRQFASAGAKLILWTMRHGKELSDAVDYLKDAGIELFGVNENPNQKSWTDSPKVYAHIYIDDAAFGCPLRESARMGGRPYVDWDAVGPEVLKAIQEETPCTSSAAGVSSPAPPSQPRARGAADSGAGVDS